MSNQKINFKNFSFCFIFYFFMNDGALGLVLAGLTYFGSGLTGGFVLVCVIFSFTRSILDFRSIFLKFNRLISGCKFDSSNLLFFGKSLRGMGYKSDKSDFFDDAFLVFIVVVDAIFLIGGGVLTALRDRVLLLGRRLMLVSDMRRFKN